MSLLRRQWVFAIVLCSVSNVFSVALAATDPNNNWQSWVLTQIETHPEVLAAKSQMEVVISEAKRSSQALYNPELNTEYEREGDVNNYRIGVSQTMDMWNKRAVYSEHGKYSKIIARANFEYAYQRKVSEALQAISQWKGAKARFELASQQETQLDNLIKLVKDRQDAGDVGQLEVELALLSLSQKLNETAQAFSALKTSEAKLHELLPDWNEDRTIDFSSILTFDANRPTQEWLDDHPVVLSAKANWESKKQQAKLTRLESKAEPTFGLNAGQSAQDYVVGLSISLPINIRNNYSAEIEASSHATNAAEAQYLATIRHQRFEIDNSRTKVEQYQQQSQRWRSLMRGSHRQTQALIEEQWRIGELSTNDYLMALQQITEGQRAGIDLQEQYELAVIQWLYTTGQIVASLTRPTE